MVKQGGGRPGVPYEKFIEAWEQLLAEGRASLNNAVGLLGGAKNTMAIYRDRYEREKASKELSVIRNIELSEAVRQAIAGVKVKEIEKLEKIITQLQARTDEQFTLLTETEEKAASAKTELEDAKVNFDAERLLFERKFAAAQARTDDLEQREQKLIAKYEKLNEQYNQAAQEAAVAKKEAEMLRAQTKMMRNDSIA